MADVDPYGPAETPDEAVEAPVEARKMLRGQNGGGERRDPVDPEDR